MVFQSNRLVLQYGLLHCYGTLMGPDYKLTYLDAHQSLLQTPLIQPVSTPLSSTRMYPDLFCPNVHCSQLRAAYATKDAKYGSFQMNYMKWFEIMKLMYSITCWILCWQRYWKLPLCAFFCSKIVHARAYWTNMQKNAERKNILRLRDRYWNVGKHL